MIDIAGPGFLNFKLNDETLWKEATRSTELVYQDENIVTEYSDPNVMKDLHAGHLYILLVTLLAKSVFGGVGCESDVGADHKSLERKSRQVRMRFRMKLRYGLVSAM